MASCAKLLELKEIAIERGGACLSNTYINSKSMLQWKCKSGHIWLTTPIKIKNAGHWCPQCGIARRTNARRLTISNAQLLAQSKSGKCLSERYINSNSKLVWQCEKGHIWEATHANVRFTSWCPDCSAYTSERICKAILENIFHDHFNKAHPKWLRNWRGNRMELDGYNEKLGIAFEYQGEQHYSNSRQFRNRDLNETKRADKLKADLCMKHGTKLIIVPFHVPKTDMYFYVIKTLKQNHIQVPPHDLIKITDLNIHSSKNIINYGMELAEKRGGRCLSKYYINSSTKLEWQCKKGHKWLAILNVIKKGHWCPQCSEVASLTIEEIKKIANKRGGECLSDTYINGRKRLAFKCMKGHVWEATPVMIKFKTWCPDCGGTKRLEINQLQEISALRGGFCLSKKYINGRQKINWKCAQGHTWTATAPKIKFGRWCPHCMHRSENILNEMRHIAQNKEGKLISTNYQNLMFELIWQCSKKHEWKMTPMSARRGNWCNKCR
ncbi:MAG: hypothetical protein NTZ36_02080 [Candidatus Jorgensenbacteria bacterium]|nr:hypothetical protein [Candidatus Jorgensenbacteria bacterium]